MSFEPAHNKRDTRLRRRILATLHLARTAPLGGISGRRLCDVIEGVLGGDQGLDGDDHALSLLIDLRDSGYAEMIDQRKRKLERYGIDAIFCKITDKGSRLVREEIPVDPSIDDERIG